jgi:hypothetical protein
MSVAILEIIMAVRRVKGLLGILVIQSALLISKFKECNVLGTCLFSS